MPRLFKYLIPLNFRAPFIFAPLIFAPLIFAHPYFKIIRAPLIFAHCDAFRAPLIFAHPEKSQNFRFCFKMCYLALWNEFGGIVEENTPIYTLEVHSEVREVSHRNKRAYLTLETFKK